MRALRVLILANGSRPPSRFLRMLRAHTELFVATDGAANGLDADDLAPDVILGDFDSIAPDARTRFPAAQLVEAEDQDHSDLEKAVRYALERGAAGVTITGACGTRPDHTLTAFSVLAAYPEGVSDERGPVVRIAEPLWEARAVSGSAVIAGRPGDTLSLVVFAPALIRRLEGVRWPLRDETLVPGSRGVSNVMTGTEAWLEVASGVVIACLLQPELARQ